MKLFLDDMRFPQDCAKYMHKRIGALNPIYLEGDWYIVRNYDQFCKAIDEFHAKITHISYDHDLADEHYDSSMYEKEDEYVKKSSEFKEKTGYECAKYMKEFYRACGLEHPVMFVHSFNPVGANNIIQLFTNKI